ncbi:MAG: hypothetical protein PUE90_03140, partial [Bacteroidales bacterium]|nr:hypothetical protein [Bacteroidales bacterium]
IFAGMQIEELPSWTLLWHLYAQSDNSLTAAQIAHRMHIPEDGVVRLMNIMGVYVAQQTGWFPIPEQDDGWKIFFTRSQNPTGEFVYSIKEHFLPILANFRK